MGNRTIFEAGTASGWISFEGIDIRKAFSESRVLKKAARMINSGRCATPASLVYSGPLGRGCSIA